MERCNRGGLHSSDSVDLYLKDFLSNMHGACWLHRRASSFLMRASFLLRMLAAVLRLREAIRVEEVSSLQ